MLPTFEDGQLVFVQPMNRQPRVGDIILLEKDGSTLIKRVAMVGGQRYEEAYVPYAHSWTTFNSSAIARMIRKGMVPCRVRTVPKGQMYIVGDNPEVSMDSRMFGLVPVSSIRGLVSESSS